MSLQLSLIPSAEFYVRPQGQGGKEKNGVVYTRSWVVSLILDLVDYNPQAPLHQRLIIEPSAGDGSFLLAIAERLITSCRLHCVPYIESRFNVIAFELDEASVTAARAALKERLRALGVKPGDASLIADSWVRQGDYLLDAEHLVGKADYVVGNPPYIRLEDLDNGGATYRAAYPTMVGRADIYVAFYEAALRQLKPNGKCSFICADRWMLNQYGAALRRLITASYSVDAVIRMHHADAFEEEVNAYPAITVLRRGEQGSALVGNLDPEARSIEDGELATLLRTTVDTGDALNQPGVQASRLSGWFSTDEPWPLIAPDKLALLQRLERDFPTLEATGTTVGIGVATGADRIFITTDAQLVESDRLLPLAMAYDLQGERLEWSGHYLVDPWNGHGLVDLTHYPRLAAYLERHREHLERRHVGRKNPRGWYRTIDRVNHDLTGKPKLYLPDIKNRIAPVLDSGNTYPHHNLYYVAPQEWDAEVLGGILLSSVAQFFVEAYSVRMRGGWLRFQAQYLRRIRIPKPGVTTEEQAERLRRGFRTHDLEAVNAVVSELYGLTPGEEGLLGH
jgi:methylase of polypeptide subunit release factors